MKRGRWAFYVCKKRKERKLPVGDWKEKIEKSYVGYWLALGRKEL